MSPVWKRSGPDPERLGELSDRRLRQAYRDVPLQDGTTADTAERGALADRIAVEILRRDPGDAAMWFDRALLAKWRRDWPSATEHGVRALELVPPEHRDGDPAAWNLGIAATARRDWATARQAWRAFGITVAGSGAEPVAEDFGPAPVRLNPPLRYVGQSPVLVDGRSWDAEVVWGRRLDPARVQIGSVPLPCSGHRHGDVVLHDGTPEGTRRLGSEELAVFDEIELWERSPRPTLGVVVTAPSAHAVAQLVDDLDAAGLAGEDWTSSVRSLCRACSEGTPGHHAHPGGAAGDNRWTVGISGLPDDADLVLTGWLGGGPGRDRGELTVELA